MNSIIESQICTLSFYLNRCDVTKSEHLYVYIDNLLFTITQNIRAGKTDYYTYLHTLYKLLFQCRDCLRGKGERDMSYIFLCAFHKYFPTHTMMAFHSFCSYYGCWADVKYFCKFVKDFKYINENTRNALTSNAIDILIYQFDTDFICWNNVFNSYLQTIDKHPRPYAPDFISMAAKWIPRESSAFRWLHDKIVERYNYIHSAHIFHENVDIISDKTLNKMKMNFRKKVVSLSKELNIAQKYMCSKQYDQLSCSNVTIQTAIRQSKQLCSYDTHDHSFKYDTFCDFIRNDDYINTHGKKNLNISLNTLVKKGFDLIRSTYDNNTEHQMKLINNTWTKIVNSINFSVTAIPVCDLSGPQKYSAIGMGMLIAQISTYKKVIIVENNFIVVDIDENNSFIDNLRLFFDYKCLFFNLESSFSCLYNKHNSSSCEPICYVILSSEENIIKNQNELTKYHDRNVHIMFWNVLNNKNSIQTLLHDKFMYMSGITPNLLYVLKNEKVYKNKIHKDWIKIDKNYSILCDSLNNYAFTNQMPFQIS